MVTEEYSSSQDERIAEFRRPLKYSSTAGPERDMHTDQEGWQVSTYMFLAILKTHLSTTHPHLCGDYVLRTEVHIWPFTCALGKVSWRQTVGGLPASFPCPGVGVVLETMVDVSYDGGFDDMHRSASNEVSNTMEDTTRPWPEATCDGIGTCRGTPLCALPERERVQSYLVETKS